MFKHATVSRTNRAQQALLFSKQCDNLQLSGGSSNPPNACQLFATNVSGDCNDTNTTATTIINMNQNPSQTLLAATERLQTIATSCRSSPSFSLLSAPSSRTGLSSAPSSVFNSPSKSNPTGSLRRHLSGSNRSTKLRCEADAMIKVFAQTLSQEVEYVTLHVNSQTKSQQIIRSLLRKFRLKHRDPNLFYLTLERWIRKDGLKFKSVMLLSGDACPLQLQQCCSNPPHNDIKFTLQMRAGALVKIFCSDVCPNTRYKCVSLSTQTTVDETIELILHCLNLISTGPSNDGSGGSSIDCNSNISSGAQLTNGIGQAQVITPTGHGRFADSPGSIGSSSSSSSTTSSSSGIESEPTNQSGNCANGRQLDESSRTGSVTSISSSSNLSNASCGNPCGEQYCLVIECKDSNYKRTLDGQEYLVDVYQNLLDEAREHSTGVDGQDIANNSERMGAQTSVDKSCQPDQWFLIKLKRRIDLSNHSIKFTNPRQNMPLPPVPLSLAQLNNANNLQHIVSTTQIEVNHNTTSRNPQFSNKLLPPTSYSSTATANATSTNSHSYSTLPKRASPSVIGTIRTTSATPAPNPCAKSNSIATDVPDGLLLTTATKPTASAQFVARNCHQKQLSEVVNGNLVMPVTGPPPATLIWLPPIRPRRRNLSNASSTFSSGLTGTVNCSRRRYDPAQLAKDLNQLNLDGQQSPEDHQLSPISSTQVFPLAASEQQIDDIPTTIE